MISYQLMVNNVWSQNEEEVINDEEKDLKWKLTSPGDGDETSAMHFLQCNGFCNTF